MEKHGVDHVDLLSIDAEGCDYEIFCSIDLARYRPRILIIETGDMTPVQRRDFDARLARAALIRLTRIDFLTEVFASRELTAGGSMLGRLVGGLRARLRRPRDGKA